MRRSYVYRNALQPIVGYRDKGVLSKTETGEFKSLTPARVHNGLGITVKTLMRTLEYFSVV